MASENNVLRILLAIVAVIVFVPVLMLAFMMPIMGLWDWGHVVDGGTWGDAGGMWIWLLMWLVVLAVVGGVGYLLYGVVRRSADSVPDPALEELRVAYVHGDLSDEVFEERHERLQRKK